MANELTGKNAVVDFGGTPYDCLTDISVDGNTSVQKVECSSDGVGAANMLKTTGAEDWVVTATIIIPSNAATIPSALDLGTTGAVIAAPAGDGSGLLTYTWTTGEIVGHGNSSGVSTHMQLAVTIECTGAPAIAAV